MRVGKRQEPMPVVRPRLAEVADEEDLATLLPDRVCAGPVNRLKPWCHWMARRT